MRIDDDERALEVTLPLRRGPRTVRVREGRRGRAAIEGATRADSADAERMVAYVLRLDEDLRPSTSWPPRIPTSRGRRPARAG